MTKIGNQLAAVGSRSPSAETSKVLLVAMPDSIHVARWLLANQSNNLEILLFASSPMRRAHPVIKELIGGGTPPSTSGNLVVRRHFLSFACAIPLWLLDRRFLFAGRIRGCLIRRAIKSFGPDLVHTMESQQGGYASYHGLRKTSKPKPKTLLTLFGSDLYWFSRFPYHQGRLRELLSITDFVQAECARDEALAKSLEFKGKFMPLLPVSAGIPVAQMVSPATPTDIESRKVIAVKGYAGKWGLSLNAVNALSLMREDLAGYTIELYSCDERVAKHASEAFVDSEVNVKIHAKFALPHTKMLELFRRSRIAIGLSRSDGLPASMLEAMSQGAFPVQTASACIEGWIVDSKTGLVVDDTDPESLATRLRGILNDSTTLHQAASVNTATIKAKYSDATIQQSAALIYDNILTNRNL